MSTTHDSVIFDWESRTISFRGVTIVDMSLVPDEAKAKFFSGVTADFQGYDTRFTFDDSRTPFNLQIASFSASGFIKAIIENRLEVEGMTISGDVHQVYTYLGEIESFH